MKLGLTTTLLTMALVMGASAPAHSTQTWHFSTEIDGGPDRLIKLDSIDEGLAGGSVRYVHAAFVRPDSGTDKAYYARSADGAATWQPAQPMGDATPALGAGIAANDMGDVLVVWNENNQLRAKISDNSGNFFPAPHTVISSGLTAKAFAVEEAWGKLHVAWVEETSLSEPIVRYRRWSSASGWTSTQTVYSSGGTKGVVITKPKLAFSGSRIHILWESGPGAVKDLVASYNIGTNWTYPVTVASNVNTDLVSNFVGDQTVLCIATEDASDKMTLHRSFDNGSSWGSVTPLTVPTGLEHNRLALDSNGQLHLVAWFPSSLYHLSWMRSNDQGTTWMPLNGIEGFGGLYGSEPLTLTPGKEGRLYAGLVRSFGSFVSVRVNRYGVDI